MLVFLVLNFMVSFLDQQSIVRKQAIGACLGKISLVLTSTEKDQLLSLYYMRIIAHQHKSTHRVTARIQFQESVVLNVWTLG